MRVAQLPPDVLAVPVRALHQAPERTTVRRQGASEPVAVDVLAVAGSLALVRGLKAGDLVAESP